MKNTPSPTTAAVNPLLSNAEFLAQTVLPFSVFRWTLGDCTAGGISATEDTIYVLGHKSHVTVGDLVKQHGPEFASKLIFRAEDRSLAVGGGDPYWAAMPALTPGWAMAGGNLASSSDSRALGRIYRIFDRFE